MKKITFLITIFLIFDLVSQGQIMSFSVDSLDKYFNEIKEICDNDNGKLWGKQLYCPMLVVDRKNRSIIANENDNENLLSKSKNVFVGNFSETKIISNSTIDYGGKYWMIVGFPFPDSKYQRQKLFLHEMFHRFQHENKLDNVIYDNSHMDNIQARILLKLEWNALEKAIRTNMSNREFHLKNALTFRQYRRSLFQNSDSMESAFETHEGLAEYNGIKLCTRNDEELKDSLLGLKDFFWNNETYVRSFGYFSGLQYAYLLDQANKEWRYKLKGSDDIGMLVKQSYKINFDEPIVNYFEISKKDYGYDSINKFETNLKQKKDLMLADYRGKFTKKKVLIINLEKQSIGFNPNYVQPLDNLGTVYPFAEITDNWGFLKVLNGGCLLLKDKKEVIIPAENLDINIKDKNIEGSGWILKLNDNCKIIKEENNYRVMKN